MAETNAEAVVYRTLRPAERGAFLDLMQAAFALRWPFELYLDHDPLLGPDDTFVALVGPRLVSSVQLFTRTIVGPDGGPLRVGGIGSVATHPDFERRGLATQLLTRVGEAMRRREMPVSLLFAARIPFYERQGWVHVPQPTWSIRWPGQARPDGPPPAQMRDVRVDDMPHVMALYADFCGGRLGTTLRDDAYWQGQLRFAGNPDECFRVAERAGRVVAYARRVDFEGLNRVTEYATRPGEEPALAALLQSFARSDDSPLCVPAVSDAAIGAALDAGGAQRDAFDFPTAMWRIEARSRLEEHVPGGASLDDAALLSRLVTDAVFWPSDRF